MARALGVHRSTCQRVVTVCSGADDLEALAAAPGIAGLRQFIDAAAQAIGDAGAVDAARTAVDRYEEFVRRTARSQSALNRRIALTIRPGAPAPDPHSAGSEQRRQLLFDLATHYVDAHAETRLHTIILQPSPHNGGTIETGIVNAYLGFVAGDSGLPLVHAAFHESASDGKAPSIIGLSDLNNAPAEGRTPSAVLDDFSTRPLPVVSSRVAGGRLLQIIDPAGARARQGMDVVTGFRISPAGTHPASHETPFLRQLCFTGVPVKRLVFDYLLHRSMARQSVPSLAVYRPNPALPFGVFDRWFDRIADAPPLQVLPSGCSAWATTAYPRYQELLSHTFDRLGWRDDDFVLHRCDVTYPLWNVEYAIMFDFSEHGLADGSAS